MADPKKRAIGKIVVTGDKGAKLPKGTIFHRADGAPFETQVDVTMDEEEQATVDVVAGPAGDAGKCDPATPLHCKDDVEGMCADAIVGVEGIGFGEEPKAGPVATAGAAGAKPKPGPAAKVVDPMEGGCFVHVMVNGRGAVRIPAQYHGSKKGLHSATYVGVADGFFKPMRLDDLPVHDPKHPVYPSIER